MRLARKLPLPIVSTVTTAVGGCQFVIESGVSKIEVRFQVRVEVEIVMELW